MLSICNPSMHIPLNNPSSYESWHHNSRRLLSCILLLQFPENAESEVIQIIIKFTRYSAA